MPDSELDKPGTKPSPQSGESGQIAPGSEQAVEETIEDELDRLLAEIDIAVEELDPTGNLQNAAASARTAAVAGDPEYDETEDLYEVIVPGGTDAAEEPADAVDTEPDPPVDETDENTSPAGATQIDQELDALLAEAETILEAPADDEPAAPEPEAPQAGVETAEQVDTPEPETAEVDTPATTEATPVAQSEPEAPAPVKPAKAAPKTTAGTPQSDYKADERLVKKEAELPAPEAPGEKAATKSIEALDSDLADRAKKIVDEDTLPEAEDVFRSSDDVVEEVIDEHASAVDDAAPAEETDELAQLMAESPASSDLGLAAGSGEKPAVKEQPDAAAPAAAAASVASAPKAVRTEKRFAAVLRAVEVIRPLLVRIAQTLSKPLEFLPPRMRDDIGWLASVTLFLAVAVWVALMLFR